MPRVRALLLALLAVPLGGCVGPAEPPGEIHVMDDSTCGRTRTMRCAWTSVGAHAKAASPFDAAAAARALESLGFAFVPADDVVGASRALDGGAWWRDGADFFGEEVVRLERAGGLEPRDSWSVGVSLERSPLDLPASAWIRGGAGADRRLEADAASWGPRVAATLSAFESASGLDVAEARTTLHGSTRVESACGGGDDCRYAWTSTTAWVGFAGALDPEAAADALAAAGWRPQADAVEGRYWTRGSEGPERTTLALSPGGVGDVKRWEFRVVLERDGAGVPDAEFVAWRERAALAAPAEARLLDALAEFEAASGLRHEAGSGGSRVVAWTDRPLAHDTT